MNQSQVHILVVDDERNIRNNLGMVLEAEGYKVDTASDGDDALNRVKEGRYDIAFVDFQMPKMDGLELLRFLRELRPKMPVVMLTAYGTTRRAVEAMKLGGYRFSRKALRSQVYKASLPGNSRTPKSRHERNRRCSAAFGGVGS